jgi:hypothetical protein
LWAYLERFGRPLAFYTDKAGMFQVAVKTKRQEQREGRDRPEMPPTQIARALREMGIVWIPAHSPQAKGRVERQFLTAQDRLVKGMRVAGVRTMEAANAYLEKEYLPWWNQTVTVPPADAADAHRPLGKDHDLTAILSHVEPRQVANDYTVRYPEGSFRSIARTSGWECAKPWCGWKSVWAEPSPCASSTAMCVCAAAQSRCAHCLRREGLRHNSRIQPRSPSVRAIG